MKKCYSGHIKEELNSVTDTRNKNKFLTEMNLKLTKNRYIVSN